MGEKENNPIKIENREQLIFTLSEAATLEHMVMLEYLFAAFSLKRGRDEGISEKQLGTIGKWEGIVSGVAVQEMLHLSLVNNMLTSIGAAPYFDRPNFPQPSRYFPPTIQLALLPFSEQALRYFLFLERPEGMAIEDVPGFDLMTSPPSSPIADSTSIEPGRQYYSTIGNLYRGIEQGFSHLVDKYGEEKIFLGSEAAQATQEYFGWPDLVAVDDLASVRKAVEAIVVAGEGARGNWENAHFGMFLRVLNELSRMREEDHSFLAARPVVSAFVRPPSGVQEDVTLIFEPFTASVADLFNASYGVALQLLSRFFLHVETDREELERLSSSAVDVMINVIKPLGILLTSLPVGSHLPNVNAGPSFEIHHMAYLLPERKAARSILFERLSELGEFSLSLGGSSEVLTAVGNQLLGIANNFGG